MNQYFRNFSSVSITEHDTKIITDSMNPHNEEYGITYHGYLDLKTTLRTSLSKDLKAFANTINLRVAGIYAFTATAGSESRIHLDGDEQFGPLPWRLSFYVKGEPGTLTWHTPVDELEFNRHAKAFFPCDQESPVVFSKLLDIKSAFVRTNIPHKLDVSNTITDRLTITATFLPRITWEELNHRLDLNGY